MTIEIVASICIPAYNRASLLQRAIESIRAQTETRIEIVVSDDASTDATPQVAQDLAAKDPRIRCLRNERNLGLVGNWNRCLAEARAPLMCLLNDDDTLAPEGIETGCRLLRRFPEAVMSAGASRHYRLTGELLRINRPFAEERLLSPVEAHRTIWLRNPWQISQFVFRTESARRIGGFYEPVGWCNDTDFILRMTARGLIVVTPVEMAAWYKHPGQLSGTRDRQMQEWRRRMVEHVMAEVKDNPDLAALRPLAEKGYLSSYAVYSAAAALKRGKTEECRKFLKVARSIGLPFNPRHKAMYFLLKASLAAPGGAAAFQAALAPILCRIAARYG
jgi:glycosyltransferase involved in cell wall biosynthesis